jgi:nicotinate-nucleotide pyrophosphorylase (carboxylating)
MLIPDVVDLIVKLALREDVGRKDITSSALFKASDKPIRAEIEAKQDGVLCGLQVAERVFRHVDENLRFLPAAEDGVVLEPGREIAYVEGPALSILVAERTALNFLGHLSGISTVTRRFVDKVKGTRAAILDTRKTTPNLRLLEKYAVAMGGGANHRVGLYDQALIKDNHLRILRDQSIPSIVEAVREAVLKKTIVGIEVKNLKELAEALKTQATYILLDNMDVKTVREAVLMRDKAKSKALLEVSGGIKLENVRDYADTGVERISIGALTHSAPWLDISLDIVG